ncbi:hypothetical protein KY290_036518 [Solanum tuberosum]|uniref:PCI domain-containing protein n=1 Tax=Solanum tuberosum TaxID=4113 RepID=A0ABQ7TUF9_SOLTU|nr:hypothetical protein KY289_036013 [Solanum tuberosum]KAH0639240.1 hypothetical protein KY285_035826 [Solanum tuberosum]KAH0737813.1 hypothetical protein KY290_036518 [Solanum tuberosum]
MKALNLAINGKVVEHILPPFKKIDIFLKEWNVGVKDHMGLFLKISNIMKKTKGSAKDSFKFLIQYLGTFLDEDASAINEKEESLHAFIAFVKAPDMFQCGLLDMPAIGQLEKDPKHALAYHEVCVVGGLLYEDYVEKMRLLTLIVFVLHSLVVPLVFCSLHIDDIEVESWVVKAISAMLLSYKIDQMNQIMYRACIWDKSVAIASSKACDLESVISTIYANKIVEDSTRTMQGLVIR